MSLLIAIEGLDGSGKSTLVEGLVATLSKDTAFYPWIYASKEPGSTWAGPTMDIRKLVLETPDFRPFERELLFYVDASLHTRFINNQGNAIIVSDRGKWSHLAYLRGYLKTGQLTWTDYMLCKQVIDKVCYEPDCVVYLNGSVSLMKERIASKKKDVIENNSDQFFDVVLETYNDLVIDWKHKEKLCLSLSAGDPTDKNIVKVVDYLKGVFHEDQLKNGNKELCPF